MFGLKELKNAIKITNSTVECPIRHCSETVPRQRRNFKRLEEFKCPRHNIYVSPSTFEYENELDNVLWKAEIDRDLLKRIRKVKRESRIARDNSEDAATWNVFRFLEKEKLLFGFLSGLTKNTVENPEVIYWSYSQSEQDTYSLLREARKEFETRLQSGSEPDIIVKSDNVLFFIEPKLTANNNTVPRSKNPLVREKYETGGDKWYSQVVGSDFETVAVAEKKYELFRFWLIGSWIAHYLGLDFYLVNLVRSEKERDIERTFRKHIKESHRRRFLRVAWEDIYQSILGSKSRTIEKDRMIEYFGNKTVGYDKNGRLQKAFPHRGDSCFPNSCSRSEIASKT
jgi:hypothetical protein